MKVQRVISIALTVAALCGESREAYANPGIGTNLGLRSQVTRNAQGGQFQVPAILRGRVDFWKDVFTKYTGNQVVVHHRDFPQIRFGVLDFSQEAKSMNAVQLERHKDKVEAEAVASIKRQLIELSQGEEPQTQFQRDAVELLSGIPGGPEKYKKIVDDDLVRTQTGIRERYAEAIRRAWKYLPVMEQIFVAEYGLPKELTRIPFIESSFDYTAYSSVGAAGIWQFMPRTARSHKMLVGRYVDERRDPLRATRAAAEYLRGAYNSLGNWPLAITSYNHGIGGVRAKVKKSGTSDLAIMIEDKNERFFGFASTNFYPEFLAALEIFNEHEKYFPEIPAQPPLRVYSYPVKSSVSVAHVSRQLDVPLDALKEANYALLEPVWRGAAKIPAGYVLRVPVEYQRGAREITPEASTRPAQVIAVSQTSNKTTHRVVRGESLISISKRYKTTVDRLMAMNGLSKTSVKPGQLIIVRESPSSRQEVVASNTTSGQVRDAGGFPNPIERAEASEPEQKAAASSYTVKAGDSLFTISSKTGASIEALKRANKLKGSKLVVGQRLVIPQK